MRYTVLVNDQPIADLSFLTDLAIAKERAEQLATDMPDADVRIEGYPTQPGGLMHNYRFDREFNEWV